MHKQVTSTGIFTLKKQDNIDVMHNAYKHQVKV